MQKRIWRPCPICGTLAEMKTTTGDVDGRGHAAVFVCQNLHRIEVTNGEEVTDEVACDICGAPAVKNDAGIEPGGEAYNELFLCHNGHIIERRTEQNGGDPG